MQVPFALPAIVTLAAIALAGCAGPPKSAEKPQVAPTPTTVSVQTCRVGDIDQTVAVSGSIVALQDVSLSAKQGGRLSDVLVREGDVVKAGQVLARVDPSDLLSQVRVDEGAVASDAAKVAQAEAAYRQQVANTKAAIDSAAASYRQQVTTSDAQIRLDESALKSAKESLSAELEGARPEERNQTQAALASAQASFEKSQADLRRYQTLHDAGAVADAEFDQYVSARDVALANLNSAKAGLRLQQEGNRRQDVQRAKEAVQQAEETLRQAQAARATNEVKHADLETALAGRLQNDVKLADVKAAKADLQGAEDTLAIARRAVEDTVVRSSIAGRVSQRTAEPGQVVTSGTVLLHVVTLDAVYFEPSVPDFQLAAINVGQKVSVTVDAYPGKVFPATITKIYPEGSASSRSVPLRVTVPNVEGLLKPNMFAQGRITTATHRNVTVAPRLALVANGDQNQLLVVQNGVVHAAKVKLGLASQDGSSVEVSGVPSDATVVTSGQSGLQDGQKVSAFSDGAVALRSSNPTGKGF